MVLMHRKDIIERYGFDPAEDSSIVPKGETTAAVNVVPDDQKIEAPTQETTSASLLSNAMAGPLKNFVSDPLMLAGLASGLGYWAWQKAKGNEEATFTEGLYSEGGVEQVKQHLEEKQKQLAIEHPDWTPEAVSQEIQNYQATPEFFQFNTERMTGPVRVALQNAYAVNQLTGVDKTPNQETFTDDTIQTLAGLLTPTGFLKVASIGGKIAGKAGRIAGHALDYTVVPGIGSYKPVHIAGNLGVGMAVDEVQRQVTGDPTLLPSGAALNEYFKQGEQFTPNTVTGPATDIERATLAASNVPNPFTSPEQLLSPIAPSTPREPLPPDLNPAALAPTEAGIGTAATVAGGVLAAGALARGAFRGRMPAPVINPNPTEIAHDIANNRAAAGIGLPQDPSSLRRAVTYSDEKLDINAPILQQARELGVEEPVQAILGQELTSHGQQLTLKNVWEHGILPDNGRATPVKRNFDIFAAADPATQAMTDDAIHAINVLNSIETTRIRATAEANVAQTRMLANPLDPALVNRAHEANQTRLLWDTYDPQIRRYLPDTDEAELQARVANARNDPAANALLQNHAEIVDTTNRTLLEGEIIDLAEYQRRRTQDPNHTGLWEDNPENRVKYDPTQERTTELRPTVRVRDPLPPMASARLSLEIAARAAANETGIRNAIHVMEAADPAGEMVRVFRPGTQTNSQFGKTVEFYQGGERYIAQFSRAHVADAIKQSPVDGGIAWNVVSGIRLAAQMAFVGGLKAPAQSLVSFLYNATTGWATQRAGTSFGYVSKMIRDIAPNSPAVGRAADIVDAINIPDRLLVYGVKGTQAAWLRGSAALGSKMMTQAITGGGLFGHIANSIPNGHQVLANIGARMVAHHDASWLMHWNRWGEADIHPMLFDRDIFANRYMRDLQRYAQGTPHGARYQWFGIKPAFNGYMSILNHVASLHQIAQAGREYAATQTRLGRRPTFNETRVGMERARISAGDMSARPGGTVARWAGATFPFVRIGMASARYIFHALTSRGPWDSTLVAGRMGAVAAAMYASQQDIESMGLTDWFYEGLNDFERGGRLWIPKIEHKVALLLGEKPDLDMENPKNNFHEWPIPQEMAAFYGTVMYGLEQFGALNRGSNRGNTSAEKDLLWNVLSTVGISSSPAINAVTIPLLGQKFDASALLRGKKPLTDIQESKGQLGTLPSGIPSKAAELVKAVFGFNGDVAISSLDAGIQGYKKTQDAVAGTYRAWDEGSSMFRSTLPGVPGMWDAEKKVYNFDAMSTENSRMRAVAKSLEDAYANTFTSAGIGRGENRKTVVDDEVQMMLAATHSFFQKGGLPSIQKQINRVNNQIDNLKASKGEKSYIEIKNEQTNLIKELRTWYTEQNNVIKQYEDYIRDSYGDRLKVEGVEPTIDGVAELVGKYVQ